ncbi:putative O-methyltransferase [Colletotrichum sublineola]|uniref:Putative O-methyltransferase n=1 Tax=Colletotrichum sublineola TaxID=1173701 RepID=A0A066XG28_COLSU|nr:putative O-methyltransferase [Colletotrichum sublineola]
MESMPESIPLDVSVATRANEARSVTKLSNAIGLLGKEFSPDKEEERLQLLKQARLLVQALETPRETMIKHCWAQPAATLLIHIGIEAGLFNHLAQNPGPKRVDQVSKALGFDQDVLARAMRHLGSMGYLKEDVIGKDKNIFQHMMINYPNGEFQNHMAGYRQGRPSWMDDGFFPVAEKLIQGADTSADAAFLVDIGGSIGHDLDEFCRKHPDAPGRHSLQDLPHVLSQVQRIDNKIELIEYDFHTEQPVKGARAYYLHSVLHDWTDEVCRSILSHITAAMKPGYSKLLVNENVLPPTGANWQATALDIMMMTLNSSRERTEGQWRNLLESAGLKIVKIWAKGDGVESLIECELA